MPNADPRNPEHDCDGGESDHAVRDAQAHIAWAILGALACRGDTLQRFRGLRCDLRPHPPDKCLGVEADLTCARPGDTVEVNAFR